MQLIIDRFEEEFAVCEDENRNMVNIKRDKLPSSVKEGDILTVVGDKIIIDPEKTNNKKKAIKKMMENLWE